MQHLLVSPASDGILGSYIMQFCCVIRLENIDYRSRRWGQIYLGTDAFVDDMQCKLLPDAKLREVRAVQKRQVAKPFAYYANKYSPRNTAIEKAYLSGGYSMKEIGDYFGLHYSWISRIMRELEKAKRKT